MKSILRTGKFNNLLACIMDELIQEGPLATIHSTIASFKNENLEQALQHYALLDSLVRDTVETHLWVLLGKVVVDNTLVGKEAMHGRTIYADGSEIQATTSQRIAALEQYFRKSLTEKAKKARLSAFVQQKAQEDFPHFKYNDFSYLLAPPQHVKKCSPIFKTSTTLGTYPVGSAHTIGFREAMEDRELATQIHIGASTAHLFGIFDGHRGEHAAAFLKDWLPEELRTQIAAHPPTQEGICKALREAFLSLDRRYDHEKSGSCASLAMIHDGFLYTATLGDSRIIVNKNGKAIQLTADQKPSNPQHKKAIEKRGGKVIQREILATVNGKSVLLKDTARIQGYLAPGRAFGNHDLKGETGQCCVPHTPIIAFYSLSELGEGSQLLIACDGLWDVASTSQVGIAVAESFGMPLDDLCARLVSTALRAGSGDNISIMIVQLEKPLKKSDDLT